MTIKIRDGSQRDAETIIKFNALMAKETEDIDLDSGTLTKGVQAVFDSPTRGRYYVAEIHGEVVGQLMTTYEWSDWRCGTIIWIQSVYVAIEHRGKGVFKALYNHVSNLCCASDYCGLRLYVHESNQRARKVYEKLGLKNPGYILLEKM